MRVAKKFNVKTTIILLVLILLPTLVFGQRIEFTKPYKYTASNDDSRNSAKTKAMEEAQAALLREIGMLVEARQKMTTKSSGNNTKEDFVEELKTYTIGKVQTTVVAGTERFTDNVQGDMVYSATFSMIVDTADLYKYLDNIVKRKQQAIDDSLLIVKKRMEEESEAARRHRAQIEQVKNDSIVRAKKVSELELSVRTARNLLEQEQELGKPLRIEKDKKERELKDAERQKDNTQKAFDNARNMSDINTDIGAKRVENERKLLQEATNNYNIKLSEYKIADENLKNANRKVETAKNNLRIAENNLAKEIGTQISTTTEIVVDKSEYQKHFDEYTWKNKFSEKQRNAYYNIFSQMAEMDDNPEMQAYGAAGMLNILDIYGKDIFGDEWEKVKEDMIKSVEEEEKSKRTANGGVKSQTPKPEKLNSKTTDGDTKIINGIECILVRAGSFTMGVGIDKSWWAGPATQKVTLTQDYYISKYPITNA